MKQLLISSFLVVTSSLFAQTVSSINPVIGDLSFVAKYGTQPVLGDNETDRIKPHLAYVEEQLRATDVTALTIEQIVVQIIKNQIGIVGGYTQAFGKVESTIPGGSLQSNSGFELAMTDTYRFVKLKLSLQTSLGVNSRNLTVKAYDESFQLRNDRWFLSSLILVRPFKKGPNWLRRPIVKLGAQANFYNVSSALTSYSSTNLVKNTIVKTGKPELLLVAELSYGLKPLLHHGHAISISYSYGLTKTMHGSVSSNLNTEAFRYSDAGSYLGIKYTFWFTKGYRTSMG